MGHKIEKLEENHHPPTRSFACPYGKKQFPQKMIFIMVNSSDHNIDLCVNYKIHGYTISLLVILI